jgi:hypothetical protein
MAGCEHMISLKNVFYVIVLLLICFYASLSFAASAENVQVEIVKLDPASKSTLDSNELLYGLIHYKSDTPVRFQAIAMFQDEPLEVGATRNPAVLHSPGSGDALVWVGYTNPTHIDAIRVAVLDEEWQVLYQVTHEADVTWRGTVTDNPREPAEWVGPLTKTERREMDFVYDPEPQKYGLLYDFIFYLTIASIPLYILLQLHMLWHYRYRWRELAVIPLFPYLIVAFYTIVGLKIDTSLQVTFLFRYTPLALLYLIGLWIAKRFWQDKLPPPKLYRQPKK